MKQIRFFLLLGILLLAFSLRMAGLNWDQGYHLHPDERMLIMVAGRLHFPTQLNPNFFNYGSLPIYLLKGTSQLIDGLFSTNLSNYQGMLYAGRMLSVVFDLLTIVIIYKISLILFKNSKIALLAAFFYSIAFFPIQNSHFFISDVYLTFFTTLLVYLLLKLPSFCHPEFISGSHEIPKQVRNDICGIWIVLIGAVFAAMMATKITSLVFLPLIYLALILEFNQKLSIRPFKQIVTGFFIFHFSFFIFSFVFMPYAYLEHNRFLSDVLTQVRMNSDPYIFPYTLQYVGTTPYLYYLKNIFLWGLGPIISLLSLIGFCGVILNLFSKKKTSGASLFQDPRGFRNKFGMTTVTLIWIFYYILYFLVLGRSAVKFMRYMLPVYPFLTILAGCGIYKIYSYFCHPELVSGSSTRMTRCRNGSTSLTISFIIIALAMLWTLMFVSIYSQKHTRIAATEWILKNIPSGSALAVEHWDDLIPLYAGEKYKFLEMTLYERPDDEKKWLGLNEKLKRADYVIIASNRLYVPLQKLKDCHKFKVCYPKTAEYYQKLFSGELGFAKVAEFTSYPRFSVLSVKFLVNDDSADESFTVYDHPKIMIFKKI